MKKFISLLLCMVMCCLLLVGCVDDTIGRDLDDYYNRFPVVERGEMELDFYIVVGEGTTEHSIRTVKNYVNIHLEDKFKTSLDIHFVTADEYVDTTLAATDAEGAERADVVLVLGKDMFDELYEAGKLVELNSYYASKDFGRINSNDLIPESLRNMITISKTDDKTGVTSNIKYVVPNNHIVGSYEYIMVHLATAQEVNIGERKIQGMTSLDNPDLIDLQNRLNANRDALISSGFNPDNCIVHLEDAMYEDRYSYVNNGYVCIEVKTPKDTMTVEDAFAASFGIIKQDGRAAANEEHYYRCMEIIYALYTDTYFRNLLQYGVEVSNYNIIDGNLVRNKTGESVYNMDLLYTGSIFNAYYCDELGWDAVKADAGTKQNKASYEDVAG